jgi:phenylpyruvate tautomerase PptA (4-oxalocrotonate tautomerase family)
MPVYQVVTSGVELDREQRDTLARRFTAAHHEVTGAPDPFIRVAFQPAPLGLMYTAGVIEPSFILLASCRAGRSEDVRHELMDRLYAIIREVTDLPPDQVLVAATDTPSGWLMEAGMILPEPDPEAEAAWMRELRDRFPDRTAMAADRG